MQEYIKELFELLQMIKGRGYDELERYVEQELRLHTT